MPQTPFLGDLVWQLHHSIRGVEVFQLLAFSILDTSDKIGITGRDDLDKRINELYNGQTNIPLPFDCIFACKVENYKEVEKIIHNAFQDNRINPKREFFTINPERVIPLLKHLQIEDATVNINDKINETITDVDKDSNVKYIKRRQNFNFIEMGINIGEK
jgi:hypothetical protein